MIYLYTMPSLFFNAPQINVPLIKGYFNKNQIKSKQFDLAINFFESCVNSTYLEKHLKKYYNQLPNDSKKMICKLDSYISDMKSTKINSKKIITANEMLTNYLKLLFANYGIRWNRRDLFFNVNISTIEDVLKLAYDKKNSIFDSVLKVKFEIKNNDIFYISIQYPFQLIYAIRFSKNIKKKILMLKSYLEGTI